MKKKIKIFIVDDHFHFRKTIMNLMNRYKNIEIVGEACSGEEYLQKVKSVFPDVVLMDIKMEKMNGIEATQISTKIYPEIKIIALTFERTADYANELFHAGAKGILSKDASVKEIVDAFIAVYNGKSLFEEK